MEDLVGKSDLSVSIAEFLSSHCAPWSSNSTHKEHLYSWWTLMQHKVSSCSLHVRIHYRINSYIWFIVDTMPDLIEVPYINSHINSERGTAIVWGFQVRKLWYSTRFAWACTPCLSSLNHDFSNFSGHQNHPEVLKHGWVPPRVSDSVGLEGSLRICISNEFPGDADSARIETTLWEHDLHYAPLNEL